MTHKPLAQQVIVVTGASSGIGLATARMAAARGAKVVLTARSGDALDRIAAEIGKGAGRRSPLPPMSATGPKWRRWPPVPSWPSEGSTPG